MDKIIENLANDTVAIICNVKVIDRINENYAIVPIEAAIGRLEDGFFVCEDGDTPFLDVTRFEETYVDENSKYFIFPKDLAELKKKYPKSDTDTGLAISYYKDIQKDILLLYRTKDSEEPMIESISKRDKEDLRKLNESVEQEYHDRLKAVHINDEEENKDDLEHIKRKELATYLKERILMNDSLMDDIATVIVANFRTHNPSLMKNILCAGPTGCGKTKTFQLIAEYANIPITVVDCNQLTAEGFVGKGMDDIFKMIYATSNGNLLKAERSILMLDEIDKIASRGDPIKDLDVQQGLLKVLEGYKFSFENKRGSGQLQMDTTFMTKVGSGAFMDIFENRKKNKGIGFAQSEEVSEYDKPLVDKDIIDTGFLPEFVGRFPLIYTYKPLDEHGLRLLLTGSKISPLNQIKERLNEEFGCAIEYDDDFLNEIIEEALKTKAGGRSLSKIISNAFIKLEGAMIDEVDEGKTIPKTLKLKKEMVKDPNNFNL